jgi:hypothetical protein
MDPKNLALIKIAFSVEELHELLAVWSDLIFDSYEQTKTYSTDLNKLGLLVAEHFRSIDFASRTSTWRYMNKPLVEKWKSYRLLFLPD